MLIYVVAIWICRQCFCWCDAKLILLEWHRGVRALGTLAHRARIPSATPLRQQALLSPQEPQNLRPKFIFHVAYLTS